MMPLIATRNSRHRMADGAALALAVAAIVAALTLLAHQPAHRRRSSRSSNGEPITARRHRAAHQLIQLSTQKTPSRQEVLDELIDDKLKVQLSKRYIADVPKREIESAYANIARRAGMSADAVHRNDDSKSGISVEALKSRIHADFVWSQIVRGKFQASLQVGEKEVAVKLQASNKEEPADYEYRLRPILFLVPRGAAPTAFEARKREAEALRARFQSCDEGLRARDDAAATSRCARRSRVSPPISASSSAMSSTTRRSAA